MAPKIGDALPEADRFDDAPRPREALALVGHADAERDILEAYRAERLPQAFLIGGSLGIGKATLAWRIARFLLAHPDPSAAAVRAADDLAVAPDHPVARQIAALSHSDVFLLRREWNEKLRKLFTEIRAEDVRRAIHLFHHGAGGGGYRICILDCAEDLNRFGANALLKLIEEPPPRSVFLIVAHRPARVLPTIRSRCRSLLLKPLTPSDLLVAVEAVGPPWSERSAADRRAAAERAQGSMRETLRLLGGNGLELDARMRRLFAGLPTVDWREVHGLADMVTGRDNVGDYETMMTAVFDWLDVQVRTADPGSTATRLAPFAEVWEKVGEAARESEALNLDRRQLVLTIFADLAAAARTHSS